MKVIAAVALVAAFLLAGAASLPSTAGAPSGAVVKVLLDKGHGSAAHIGGGLYLTAAHVVRDQENIRIKTLNGAVGSAEMLWQSKEYDVALIRATHLENKEHLDLECRQPAFGEDLEFRGNPLNLEHISTWGKAAGKPTTFDGFWREALPVHGTVIPGMSGGAVLDAQGDLVGINVGTMVVPIGFAGGPAAIGYIVAGDVICELLGRSR